MLLEFRLRSVKCFGFKTAEPVLTTELWERGKIPGEDHGGPRSV